MANNLWDDEPAEEFRDIPDETRLDSNKVPMQAPPAQVANPNQYRPSNVPAEPVRQAAPRVQPEPEYDVAEVLEDFDPEEDFTEVLNDANLRIEQGRLYQMIMNHNLFEGMDADARAVKNVEREIRKFARERMEIMLGMRKETTQIEHLEIDFPFNELEVEVLKKIAFTATKGATANSDNYVPTVRKTTEEVPNVPAKRNTLNPIGGSTGAKRPQLKPQAKLAAKPQAPIARQPRVSATAEQIAAEEGVPVAALELEYTGIGKPLHQLTPEELEIRRKETAKRLASRTTVKSPNALPMATEAQQQMLAVERATQIGQAPGMSALLAKVASMPVKN